MQCIQVEWIDDQYLMLECINDKFSYLRIFDVRS